MILCEAYFNIFNEDLLQPFNNFIDGLERQQFIDAVHEIGSDKEYYLHRSMAEISFEAYKSQI